MLKSRNFRLSGRDDALKLRLTELPALLADAHARKILRALGADPNGGIAALALRHAKELPSLGPDALLDLVQAALPGGKPLDIRQDLRDWRSVARLQQMALLLHVDFLFDRIALEVPVTFQAQSIMSNAPDLRPTFCSPQIAAVLESGKASYRELETVLSTEDVYNLVEIINISAVRNWHSQQANS